MGKPDSELDRERFMPTCPVCDSSDALMNVPGVVARGTQRGESTGQSLSHGFDWRGNIYRTQSRHHHHSTSSTELAAELSFPANPKPGEYWRAALLFVLAGGLGLIYDGVAALVFHVVLFGGFFGASVFFMVRTWGRSGFLRNLVNGVGAFVTFGVGASLLIPATSGGLNAPPVLTGTIMLLLLILGVWTFVFGRREHRAFRRAAPERHRAYELWEGLYYCSRDHVVVDPRSGRFGPPGAVRKLIYPR